MKKAFITGITGQDGSFLAEYLLAAGYRVYGFTRRDSWHRKHCASHLANQIEVLFGEMSEGVDIADALQASEPDEIYNLASQSRPGESWSRPAETLIINGLAPVHLFEAVRRHCPEAHVFHASSSEMYGGVGVSPQNESTPFHPVNPYATAKVYAHQMAGIYRKSYGLFISCGILFNHESERRPLNFLPQKVAYGAACAAEGIKTSVDLNELGKPIVENGQLSLGTLDIRRDWGYAGDFVKAMWLMLQAPIADDYVVGTGLSHSLKDLCHAAYDSVGLDWREHVISDPSLVRPIETGNTVADPQKAHEQLGWSPLVGFESMIGLMVDHQRKRLRASSTA